jgi:hypothetical protein
MPEQNVHVKHKVWFKLQMPMSTAVKPEGISNSGPNMFTGRFELNGEHITERNHLN